MEGTSFRNAYNQMGNINKKRLAYTALVRPIPEYEAVSWDPCREGKISTLNCAKEIDTA